MNKIIPERTASQFVRGEGRKQMMKRLLWQGTVEFYIHLIILTTFFMFLVESAQRSNSTGWGSVYSKFIFVLSTNLMPTQRTFASDSIGASKTEETKENGITTKKSRRKISWSSQYQTKQMKTENRSLIRLKGTVDVPSIEWFDSLLILH